MSKDSYYPQLFKCKCGTRKEYTWLSQLNDNMCETCSKKMKPVFEEINEAPAVINAATHRSGRGPQERNKRRIDDFTKNILPTMGGSDKRYFTQKYGKKKK